jgi:phage terminase large subunit-like protein
MADPALELPSLALLKAAQALQQTKIQSYFPDHGPLQRKFYPRHMEAIELTKTNNEVLVLGANRVGKTQLGAYCATVWLTGVYPKWWQGRKWDRPVKMWGCGDTAKTVRDIVQFELLGPIREMGSGFLPRHLIHYTTNKVGTAEAVETIWVKHASGGNSEIVLKSYDQRREAFVGQSVDKEPPMDIYAEQLLRTLTTKGLMLLTLTPLLGMTQLIADFLRDAGGQA